jgi:malate dehydrogenase
MELDDCAFPTLAGVVKADSDHLEDGFRNCNYVVCVGSIPRKQGMERGDLIKINGPIFTSTGRAIAAAAASDVKVLVVGNPCNTNALIAMHNAPGVPSDRFYAMTRLDENRAVSLLARKSGQPVSAVSNLAIWGNHSATQYPDFYQAKIGGKPVTQVIGDQAWLQSEFLTTVQQRGAAVIKARGASSAASAANAIVDNLKSIHTPTPSGQWFSAAVCSDGSYGVDPGLISSFPLTTNGTKWSIVPGLQHNDFARAKIDASVAELRATPAAGSTCQTRANTSADLPQGGRPIVLNGCSLCVGATLELKRGSGSRCLSNLHRVAGSTAETRHARSATRTWCSARVPVPIEKLVQCERRFPRTTRPGRWQGAFAGEADRRS